MKNYSFLGLAGAALLGLASCSKSTSDDPSATAAKLEVRLTDAPGNFNSVVLDVRQIEVHLKDEGNPDGWQTLNFTPQTVNVLDYVNGKSALLVNTDFAPGDLKEIRLILGPNSYVVGTDGQQYDLKTPSGQTSGVKLKLDKVTLKQRETFQLLLDFDVAKSIVERGNWKAGNDKKERYLLKPVIRLVAQDLKGGLGGLVSPAAARPQVLAIRSSILGPDTVSTYADASGAFQLRGLPAGTYQVQFFPTVGAPAGQPAYKNVVRTGITVDNVQATDLGLTPLN
ncbi:DUF4382 domain-containing protein [Hymenobacter sp. PAMC 26628]|uniref:DUF4382 domain-containing protein n=1 Tax=Hymenobacter sp. PAMC 26628 TaxID=1484118 RepID=UPI000770077E|nr:DUF4382 domain-containing protein [Hymenobacter sp. PAMC 26628]AMJ67601.1 hypothetical protein AXW84_20895 [Hymenobacter sp. PAMC 26628]